MPVFNARRRSDIATLPMRFPVGKINCPCTAGAPPVAEGGLRLAAIMLSKFGAGPTLGSSTMAEFVAQPERAALSVKPIKSRRNGASPADRIWRLSFGFKHMRYPASRPKQPRVLRFVPCAGEVGPHGRRAEIVERRAKRAVRRGGNGRLERGEHALAVGLAERHQPHAR
jgi:hypothetical protein